jgi:starch phosphorylase
MPSVHAFTVLPAVPEELKDLDFIARNMYWCWNLEFVSIFKRIDSRLWRAWAHNPVRLLGGVPQERLNELAANRGFVSELKRASEKLKSYLQGQSWYDKIYKGKEKPVIAYFCAEYGIHESLPVYSGGLGILAGDHLKSASDLGVPLVGVGLLYQKGYFRQYLNVDGWQQEVYSENDFYNMPIELITKDNGQPIKIGVEFPGREVKAQIWSVSVGRIKLYLLDTNIEENTPDDRMMTSILYGGDLETRICQEILLGIGGLRALLALGIEPTVCHMNEGHAAFMGLERIRLLKNKADISFDQALEATKSGSIFTIHTPVKAGNDEFPPEMMEKYFANYYPRLGINKEQFLALGRITASDDKEVFKMPVLALRLSSYRNGVSKLHGDVSRKMWSVLWPEVPNEEVPITSITNGVHIKSWLSEEMNLLYERYLGDNWSEEIVDGLNREAIDQIPDEEFWRIHQRSRESLVTFSRARLMEQLQRRGTYHTELNWAEEVLDPEALTIGFARRFTTYKRGNLLFKDPGRLVKLLNDPERPVQIILAGKAHPKDSQGKEIIRQIIHFSNQYNVRRRVVFLEDYDLNLARYLVRGVDVWLNNPRPPMEASGTSGMKAALNGALNMSTLDGWWCEGYRPEGGWAIGAGEVYQDPSYQDVVESKAIYNLLEKEVVPLFYTRCADGLPRGWIHRVKESIKWITPNFNTNRMVADYTMKFYNPAAERYRYLAEQSMAKAKEFSDWKSRIKAAWSDLNIKDVQASVVNGQLDKTVKASRSYLKVGSILNVKVLVKLGRIKPDDVSVELYNGPVDAWGKITNGSSLSMDCKEPVNHDGEYWFEGKVKCTNSGRQGFAVRILPRHKDMVNPNEMGLILWEKSL